MEQLKAGRQKMEQEDKKQVAELKKCQTQLAAAEKAEAEARKQVELLRADLKKREGGAAKPDPKQQEALKAQQKEVDALKAQVKTLEEAKRRTRQRTRKWRASCRRLGRT